MKTAPEPTTTTAYTQDQATEYDRIRFTSPAGQRIHRAERGILFEALKNVDHNARILELGCGTGRLLVDAWSEGYRIDAQDLSSHMLEELRGKLPKDAALEVIESGAAEVPKPDASYDFVYAIRLLNQTESPEYALNVVREMMRLVKPNGYALVEFVNARRPRWGINKRPTTRLTPAEVAGRGEESGGTVIRYAGAFLLSMQAYRIVPGWMTPMVASVDHILSTLLPRLCSRSYVLFRKRDAQL